MSRRTFPALAALAAGLALLAPMAEAAERMVPTRWKAETRQLGPSLVRSAGTAGNLAPGAASAFPELVLGFECADPKPPILKVGVGATATAPLPMLGDAKLDAPLPIAFEFRTATPHWLTRTIGAALGEDLVPDAARSLDAVRREARTVLGTDLARRGGRQVAAVRGDDMLALAELMKVHQSVTVHMGRDTAVFSLAGAATAMTAAGCPVPVR